MPKQERGDFRSKTIKWPVFYLLAILHVLSSCHASEVVPPNIILIMADDLGYAGVSSYGNEALSTPNIDRLAVEGLRFTDFHSNGSVCTPTRAALLTGRYQQRAGMEGVIYVRGKTRQVGLDTQEVTIADQLKAQGYKTAIMGKWHLGYLPEYNPTHFGFDEFYGYLSGNIDFHTHFDNAGIYDWWHNMDTIQEEGYVTDLITQHCLEFIEENKHNPFFLYVPHEAPHVPFQGRNDPGYRYENTEFTYHGPVRDTERAYIEMTEVMDEGIGDIVQRVNELGLRENTLIIFLSDNGAESFGYNGALRGAKISLYEGGHRVPGIFSWPGKIEPGVSDALAISHDIMPTILHFAGADLPTRPLDGINLASHLTERAVLPNRRLFWRYRDQKAVRHDDYKLLLTKKDTMMFDLSRDLAEQIDISNHLPEKRKEMLKQLRMWEDEIGQYAQKTH